MQDKETYRIGIVLTNFMSYTPSGILEEISKVFREQGHITLYTETNGNLEDERRAISYLVEETDGLIIMSCAKDYSEIEDVLPDSFPAVFLLSYPRNCRKSVIIENDYSAIYQGILSLSNQNFRKIACVIENPDTLVGQSYIKAYEDALTAIGQPIEKNMMIEIEDFTSMNPTKIFSQIIACGAEAVFCTSSALTVSLSDCLIYYNHNINNKPIPLLGYGVSDVSIASFLSVDLISHSVAEFANLAFQTLIYCIRHPNETVQKERVLQLKGTLQMHRYNGLNITED